MAVAVEPATCEFGKIEESILNDPLESSTSNPITVLKVIEVLSELRHEGEGVDDVVGSGTSWLNWSERSVLD
jgi:hypothetical protein